MGVRYVTGLTSSDPRIRLSCLFAVAYMSRVLFSPTSLLSWLVYLSLNVPLYKVNRVSHRSHLSRARSLIALAFD